MVYMRRLSFVLSWIRLYVVLVLSGDVNKCVVPCKHHLPLPARKPHRPAQFPPSPRVYGYVSWLTFHLAFLLILPLLCPLSSSAPYTISSYSSPPLTSLPLLHPSFYLAPPYLPYPTCPLQHPSLSSSHLTFSYTSLRHLSIITSVNPLVYLKKLPDYDEGRLK